MCTFSERRTANADDDSGCSWVVVKMEFATDNQCTERTRLTWRIDKTLVEALTALIQVNTPFLTGAVEALCLQDVLYGLIIRNVEGARTPDAMMQLFFLMMQHRERYKKITS